MLLKYARDHKKYEIYEIKYRDCEYGLEYTDVKDDLILYKCLCYYKNYQKKVQLKLFILMLQKGIQPYECMHDCEKFREKSLPEKEDFYSLFTRISMVSSLEKTKVKLDLLTGIDMLLMVEKGIRGRICHTIHRCAKANNKYMKDYDENRESSYLKCWDINNLYAWGMS